MPPENRTPLWRSAWLAPALAAAVVAYFLLIGLGDAGLWDPVEVHAAEISRRLAAATEPLPTRDELGAGELPFDSIALGFRLFGISAGAGRTGLAVWATLGVVAVVVWLSRFADRRAALYGGVILASLPLYFLQARTMAGDIATMATGAIAFAALSIAVFDDGGRRRVLALVLGVAALGLGVLARGVLVGIALPALTVGIAWALTRIAGVPIFEGDSDRRPRDRTRDLAGGALLVIGVGALGLGSYVLFTSLPGTTPFLLGIRVAQAAPRALSFDLLIAQLGHALFPWSAFVPFAFGRALFRPATASLRESHGRLLLVVATALAFGILSLVASRATVLPFVAPAAISAIVALALRDLERGAPPSFTMAVATVGMGVLLARDFLRAPETGLAPFVTENAVFPHTFDLTAHTLVITSAVLFLGVAGTLMAIPTTGFAALVSPSRRGGAIVLAGVLAALVFRAAYYPRLAEQLSPKGVFDSYARHRRGAEPLALLGVNESTALYGNVGAVTTLAGAAAADTWLFGGGAPARKWLALRGDELPAVNALFRARSPSPRNLPVLDGRSSAVLLASNELATDEQSASPLDAIVLAGRPSAARPAEGEFGNALAAVGWEVTGAHGERLTAAKARKPFHLRVYLGVRAKVHGGYCTFVHIDHTPTRFSAEHTEWAAYPMIYWNVGDVLADDYEITLPAPFRAGSYSLYFGIGELPCTGDGRMKVTRGASDGHDRLLLGSITVGS